MTDPVPAQRGISRQLITLGKPRQDGDKQKLGRAEGRL